MRKWATELLTTKTVQRKMLSIQIVLLSVRTVLGCDVRLTDNALLLRCARSATQNADEALNGLVWGMCPKESFCSRQTVETDAHLATAIFNDGYKTVANILSASGCAVSPSITAFPSRFDADKAYHKRCTSSEEEKSAKKRRWAIRKGFADRAQQEEGETCCTGGF